MLVDQRRSRIVDMVRQRGAMSIKELSPGALCFRDDHTAGFELPRRDPGNQEALRRRNRHIPSSGLAVTSFSLRLEQHVREKEVIAGKGA